MIITNGKLLYHFYSTSRDYITNETATIEAVEECIELVGGSNTEREATRQRLFDILTVVDSVKLIG